MILSRRAARIIAGMIAGLGLIARVAPAMAQVSADILPAEFPDQYSRGHSVSVQQRPRPDYDPIGMLIDSLMVYPQLDVGVGSTDNVYATPSQQVGDMFGAIDPSVRIQSNWNTHMVSLGAGAHLREFFVRTPESENGWYVNTDDRLDIDTFDTLSAGGTVEKTYLERDAGSYPVGAAAPIGLFHTAAYLRGQRETGRLRLSAAADFDGLRYDDVASLNGGVISQSFQNRDVWRLSGRGEYGMTPDAAVFTQATYTHTGYTNQTAGFPDQSSNDYRVLAGATFDTPNLVRGTVGLGVETRAFTSTAYPSLTGVTAAVKVEYFPTDLITVTGSFRRLIEDAQTDGSNGYFNNGGDIRIDYELLRNLLLDVQGDYEIDDFSGIRRSDTIASAAVGGRYMVSPRYQLHADLTYLHRDTSGVFTAPAVGGPVFDEVRFLFGIAISP